MSGCGILGGIIISRAWAPEGSLYCVQAVEVNSRPADRDAAPTCCLGNCFPLVLQAYQGLDQLHCCWRSKVGPVRPYSAQLVWVPTGWIPEATAKAEPHPKMIMLSIFLNSKGLLLFELLPHNTSVTVHLYCQQLDHLVDRLHATAQPWFHALLSRLSKAQRCKHLRQNAAWAGLGSAHLPAVQPRLCSLWLSSVSVPEYRPEIQDILQRRYPESLPGGSLCLPAENQLSWLYSKYEQNWRKSISCAGDHFDWLQLLCLIKIGISGDILETTKTFQLTEYLPIGEAHTRKGNFKHPEDNMWIIWSSWVCWAACCQSDWILTWKPSETV